MEHPDETLWELEVSRCDDGDILIEQGRCWSCDESLQVRLHRSQMQLVAEMGGFVPVGEVTRATERLSDRLNLLASLVRAHTKPGDPLRVVTDDLMRGFPSKPLCSPLEAQPFGDVCLSSAAGGDNGHPEQPNGDLFADADRAGGEQDGDD